MFLTPLFNLMAEKQASSEEKGAMFGSRPPSLMPGPPTQPPSMGWQTTTPLRPAISERCGRRVMVLALAPTVG